MDKISYMLSLLAASSVAATVPQTGGRPIYPYALATTKAERLAHVKRRQASNKPKTGRKARHNRFVRATRSMGPSRKMFVARTDGGNGP